ncbi:hypothetical protein B0H10DRAFT_1953370 [Mycena sp. CBHHK59/15]|nr:hypothetical protein B0H10DRAFT_1953370 [Mycena sp. CBHHK59/15]
MLLEGVDKRALLVGQFWNPPKLFKLVLKLVLRHSTPIFWSDWDIITRRSSGLGAIFGPNFNLKEPDFWFKPINYEIHTRAAARRKIEQKRALLSFSLEIETYIDLSAAKLKECFAPDQGKPQPEVPKASKKPARQLSSKWTATDTEWDAAAW